MIEQMNQSVFFFFNQKLKSRFNEDNFHLEILNHKKFPKKKSQGIRLYKVVKLLVQKLANLHCFSIRRVKC